MDDEIRGYAGVDMRNHGPIASKRLGCLVSLDYRTPEAAAQGMSA
jgi:hypothetical protein